MPGTETGVYFSADDGGHWQPLKLNLPAVPIHDLEIHGDDLIAATHGRAFWVLDDITPLRQLDAVSSDRRHGPVQAGDGAAPASANGHRAARPGGRQSAARERSSTITLSLRPKMK